MKLRLSDEGMYVEDGRLPWSERVTYIGVILDRGLTFEVPVKQVKTKAEQARNTLFSLLCNDSERSANDISNLHIWRTGLVHSSEYTSRNARGPAKQDHEDDHRRSMVHTQRIA